jgi:hypothetical protein
VISLNGLEREILDRFKNQSLFTAVLERKGFLGQIVSALKSDTSTQYL